MCLAFRGIWTDDRRPGQENALKLSYKLIEPATANGRKKLPQSYSRGQHSWWMRLPCFPGDFASLIAPHMRQYNGNESVLTSRRRSRDCHSSVISIEMQESKLFPDDDACLYRCFKVVRANQGVVEMIKAMYPLALNNTVTLQLCDEQVSPPQAGASDAQ